MTDVRPQAMALQNSITLDKKFGIEISIFSQTVQARCLAGHVKHTDQTGWNAATVLQGGY